MVRTIRPMPDTAWSPQLGPQSDAIACGGFCRELFYGGAVYGGKGLLPSEPVLTPFGFRRLDDIRPGSRICTTDGGTQEVLRRFDRGSQPLYCISWSDGTQTVCDGDHIWCGYWAGKGQKRGGERVFGPAAAQKIHTSDLAEGLESGRRFGVPLMTEPCVFNVHGENRGRTRHISRTIPPYVLGALLGDGHLVKTGASITTGDPEIASRIADELPDGTGIRYRPSSGTCPSYGLLGLAPHLRDLGLGAKGSADKFIPRIYLLATVEERWALLQGLMDSDGWCDLDGDCYYTSVSRRLADDVQALARSMGAFVTRREGVPKYRLHGELKDGKRAYTLRIKMPDAGRLFSLERKRERCPAEPPRSMVKWVDAIEPAGHGETICLVVSHPNSLFVIGGYAVTHHSDFLLGDFLQDIHQGSNWGGVLFRQTSPELDDIIERSQEIYPRTGGEFLVGQRVWKWPNGAYLRLRHMESENDFQRYMGWSLAWLAYDELPNWASLHAYKRMLSRLRGPAHHKRVRSTGNPGGRCHSEIKEYFHIDETPGGNVLYDDPVSKSTRMYIPSRVTDNKIGLARDPHYIDQLKGVGDPELVKAWLDGDWNAVVGAYFSMYRRATCECDPFEIPDGWVIVTCGDYGESNATWWGILAVDSDDHVWVVDEYERSDAGGAEHARGVRDMIDQCPYIRGKRPSRNLAPHDMWTKRRPGEASEARAPEDSFRDEGVFLKRANMDRVNGWRNLKSLLYAGRLHFFQGRTDHVQESLASVQRDPNNAEDVLKGGNDHAADGLRLGVNHVYKAIKVVKKDVPLTAGVNILAQLQAMGTRKTRYGE